MLIIIGRILFFSVIGITNISARTPDIKSRLYLPAAKINDLSFSIRTPQIDELLKLKTANKTTENLQINIYKFKESKDIKIRGFEKLPKSIEKKVKELFLLKAEIVLGSKLNLWLAGHKYIQEKGGWFTYEDKSGILDEMEVKLKFLNKKLTIVQKRPTGTLKASYLFSSKPWSKKLLVLDSVKREIYEGNQSVITNSVVTYEEHKPFGWLPSRVNVKTMQRVNSESEKLVQRIIKEEYFFENYHVNKGIAKSWFSTFRK